MMNQTPYFSIVIPSYNRAGLLLITLESVLQQHFQDFEVLVVDNCSTDHTEQVMRRYNADARVRYIRNERNMERAFSRNVGFANAKGAFLTLLDSDDIMYPECLQDAYDYTVTHDHKIFHNLYEVVDLEGKPSRSIVFPPIKNQHKQICQGNFLSCIGVFLSKEIYTTHRFTEDPLMIGSEDYEIWFKVLAQYPLGRINKINCAAREHPGRSVHHGIYKNLEYQRQQLVQMIRGDEQLINKYHKYLGYISSINFFHQAMYAVYKGERKNALNFITKSINEDKGILFKKRFLAFSRNFLFSVLKPSSKRAL